MKLICDQSELSRYLQVVVKAVSTKLTFPALTGILMETTDSGLHCVATDLDLSIEINIPNVQVIEPGKILIPGKTFTEIVRHLPSGPLEMSQDTTNVFNVSAGKSSYQLPILAHEEFPTLNVPEGNISLKINSAELKEIVRKTSYATLADDPRPFLSSILWETTEGKLRIVATDVNRLAIKDINIDLSAGNAQILIPVRAMKEMSTIFGNNLDEDIQVSISERMLFVSQAGISFSTRLVEAQFPRYEQVIPKEFNGTMSFRRLDLINALERSSFVSSSIKIKIANDQLELMSKEPDKGNFQETFAVQLDGENIEIGFNVRYLMEFLKAIDSEKVIFKYTQNQKPVLMYAEDDISYQYIVMPLKLSI